MRRIVVNFHYLWFLIIGFCSIHQSQAQNSYPLEKLAFKLGHWEWRAKTHTANGIIEGVGKSHVYFINDSTALIDDHSIDWGGPNLYRAITYRTYDYSNEKYMVIWAQANTGNTLRIEGHWEEETFIEINSGEDQQGKWTNRLEISDILADSHKAKLIRTYENGKTYPILEYIATRQR